MGKQGRQAYQGQWDASWHASPSWTVWPGAWPRKGAKDYGAKGQGKLRFPSYDGDWGEHKEQITVVEERRAQPTSGQTLSSVVQQTVNVSRKAELKVAKLKRAIVSKEEKWQSYQAAMKAAFNREKQRCEKDQQRLHAELTVAMQEEEEAHQLLATAAAEFTSAGKELPNVDAEWEAFLGRPTEPEEVTVQTLSRQLNEALKRRAQENRGHQVAHAGAPGLPRPDGHVSSSHPAPAPPMPPAYNTKSPVRAETSGDNPFGSREEAAALHAAVPASGLHATGPPTEKRSSPLHPGQRRPDEARQPTHTVPPREGVKPATMKPTPPEPPHSSLASKLNNRRALTPFGGPPDALRDDAKDQDNTRATELSLKYDDGSDGEQEIMDAPMSPGLGELG